MTLLVLLMVSIGLTGCSFVRPIVIHPIEKSDITEMKKGIGYVPEKDGYFVSDYYIKEVMRARVEAINK